MTASRFFELKVSLQEDLSIERKSSVRENRLLQLQIAWYGLEVLGKFTFLSIPPTEEVGELASGNVKTL